MDIGTLKASKYFPTFLIICLCAHSQSHPLIAHSLLCFFSLLFVVKISVQSGLGGDMSENSIEVFVLNVHLANNELSYPYMNFHIYTSLSW